MIDFVLTKFLLQAAVIRKILRHLEDTLNVNRIDWRELGHPWPAIGPYLEKFSEYISDLQYLFSKFVDFGIFMTIINLYDFLEVLLVVWVASTVGYAFLGGTLVVFRRAGLTDFVCNHVTSWFNFLFDSVYSRIKAELDYLDRYLRRTFGESYLYNSYILPNLNSVAFCCAVAFTPVVGLAVFFTAGFIPYHLIAYGPGYLADIWREFLVAWNMAGEHIRADVLLDLRDLFPLVPLISTLYKFCSCWIFLRKIYPIVTPTCYNLCSNYIESRIEANPRLYVRPIMFRKFDEDELFCDCGGLEWCSFRCWVRKTLDITTTHCEYNRVGYFYKGTFEHCCELWPFSWLRYLLCEYLNLTVCAPFLISALWIYFTQGNDDNFN